MWSRLARSGRLMLALLAPAAAARAQHPDPAPGGAGQAQPAAGSSEGAPFEAALREADRRFVAGDLQGALAVLQPVCVATDSAECAFSLGAVQHGLGHCPEALAHYRRYLQLAPGGEHLAEVTAALEEVEGRCGSAVSAAAPVPPVAAPPSAVAAQASPGVSPALAPLAEPSPEPSSFARDLTAAAFVVSGAAALSSVVLGVLAARSARRCARADAYDQRFIDECEVRGPRYQSLWQGSAIASGAFLGVGVALWWSSSRSAPAGVSGAGWPGLSVSGRF